MNARRFLTLLVLAFVSGSLFSQIDNVTEEYVKRYKAIAMKEMRDYKIPASITLAQGILESNSGRSELAINARNHFGIKCHQGWEGGTYLYDDDAKDECFRVYDTPEESFRDHSLFLTSRDRYKMLFDLNIKDYESWAKGLKVAGYATDKNYPTRLIDLINRYELFIYDQIALGEIEDNEPALVVVSSPVASQNIETAVSVDKYEPAYVLKPNASIPVGATKSGRPLYENNGVRFIYANKGDTPQSLAKELHIYAYQINNYNYIDKKSVTTFKEGDFVYVEKLKKESDDKVAHTIVPGETLRDVALRYAVSMERIKKYNHMGSDNRVHSGKVLLLRTGAL